MGPPVGGALYKTFGFRAPFVVGITFAAVDLLGRLLIIEVHPTSTAAVHPSTSPLHVPSDAEKGVDGSPDQQNVAKNTLVTAPVRLTFIGVLLTLLKSSRAMTAGLIALVFG